MTDAIVRSERSVPEGDGGPPLVGRERELALLRERLASTLIVLAARLAPSAGEALVANRPATGTTLH